MASDQMRKLERELADAVATQGRTVHTAAHPETLARIDELRYALDRQREVDRDAEARAAAASAETAKDPATVAKAMRAEWEKLPSPFARAAWDQRHGPELAALEQRAATSAPTAPAANTERDAAIARDRERFAELRTSNPIAASAFLDRHPWAAPPQDGAA